MLTTINETVFTTRTIDFETTVEDFKFRGTYNYSNFSDLAINATVMIKHTTSEVVEDASVDSSIDSSVESRPYEENIYIGSFDYSRDTAGKVNLNFFFNGEDSQVQDFILAVNSVITEIKESVQ